MWQAFLLRGSVIVLPSSGLCEKVTLRLLKLHGKCVSWIRGIDCLCRHILTDTRLIKRVEIGGNSIWDDCVYGAFLFYIFLTLHERVYNVSWTGSGGTSKCPPPPSLKC